MWWPQVVLVLRVIERVLPIAEALLPTHGAGEQKTAIVKGSAIATGQTVLPGVPIQEDPALQALVQAKIQADVALANALQQAAESRGLAPPHLSTVANLDAPPQ